MNEMGCDQAPELPRSECLPLVLSPLPKIIFAKPQRQAREDDDEYRDPSAGYRAGQEIRWPKGISVHGYAKGFVLSSSLLPDGSGAGRRMSLARSTVGLPQRGFTLIEVMVVVVIIGLLAAIVVPNLIGNIDRAAVTRAKGDIRTQLPPPERGGLCLRTRAG